MSKPLVSVILPIYNAGDYLKEAIQSILDQSYSNFEFVIINDGSTDDSEKIIRSYTDKRIVYVAQANMGLAATLNRGIDPVSYTHLILFVSHSIETVLRLCNKGILLEKGKVKSIGAMNDVAKAYMDTNTGLASKRNYDPADKYNPGGDKVKLLSVYVHDKDFTNKDEFDVTQPIGVTMEYDVTEEDVYKRQT